MPRLEERRALNNLGGDLASADGDVWMFHKLAVGKEGER